MALTEQERKEKQRQYLAKLGIEDESETAQDASSGAAPAPPAASIDEPDRSVVRQSAPEDQPLAPSVTKVGASFMPRARWPGYVFPTEKAVEYDEDQHQAETAEREIAIQMVASMKFEYDKDVMRRIAVNYGLIVYSIQTHIRVIGWRLKETVKILLRNHDEAVVDLEFQNKSSEFSTSHVLGSCSKDGVVYLWWIDTTPGSEKELQHRQTLKWKHPAQGSFYRKIAFNSSSEGGIEFALCDAETGAVRVLRADSSEVPATDDVDGFQEKFLIELVVAYANGNAVTWNVQTNARLTAFRLPGSSAPLGGRSLVQLGSAALLATCEDLAPTLHVVAPAAGEQSEQQELLIKGTQGFTHRNLIEIDPTGEFVVLGRQLHNLAYVIHYNSTTGMFDAITAIRLRHPVVSFTVTRFTQTSSNAGKVLVDDTLYIWCVETQKVQSYCVSARDCMPRVAPETPLPEAGVEAAAKSMEGEVAEVLPPKEVPTDSAQVDTAVPIADSELSATVADESPRAPAATPAEPDQSLATDEASGGATAGEEPAAPSVDQQKSDEVPAAEGEEARDEAEEKNEADEPAAEARPDGLDDADPEPVEAEAEKDGDEVAANKEVDNKAVESDHAPFVLSSNLEKALRHTIVSGMADKRRRLQEKLIEEIAEREAVEKERFERLLGAITKTLKSNIEEFVSEAIRQYLGPAISSPVSGEMSGKIDGAVREATSVVSLKQEVARCISADVKERALNDLAEAPLGAGLEEVFMNLLVASNLGGSFRDASTVMATQVSQTITDGVDKGLRPELSQALASLRAASSDVLRAAGSISHQVGAVAVGLRVPPAAPAAVRSFAAEVDRAVSDGIYDSAMRIAMESDDRKLIASTVSRLNEHRDAVLLELTNERSILGLVRFLGRAIALPSEAATHSGDGQVGDLDVILDWLEDALLTLEPDDPEVQDAAAVLSDVKARCEALYRELTALGDKMTAKKVRVVLRLLPTS